MSPLAIHALLEFYALGYPNKDGTYARNAEAIRQLKHAGLIMMKPETFNELHWGWELTKAGREFVEQLKNTIPGISDRLRIVVKTVGDISHTEIEGDAQIIGEAYNDWLVKKITEERDDYAKVNAALITVNAELIEIQKSLVETNDYLGTECRRLIRHSNRQHKIIVDQLAELQGRF